MKFHPLSALFPLMRGQRFDSFVANIKKRGGLIEPITMYEGRILDGRNRWLACEAAGITDPPMVEYDGDDPRGFVFSKNVERRQLSETQRGMIAARMSTLKRGRPAKNVGIPTITQSDAAALLHISRDTVIQAAKVIESGTLEMIDQADSGERSLHAILLQLTDDKRKADLHSAVTVDLPLAGR